MHLNICYILWERFKITQKYIWIIRNEIKNDMARSCRSDNRRSSENNKGREAWSSNRNYSTKLWSYLWLRSATGPTTPSCLGKSWRASYNWLTVSTSYGQFRVHSMKTCKTSITIWGSRAHCFVTWTWFLWISIKHEWLLYLSVPSSYDVVFMCVWGSYLMWA